MNINPTERFTDRVANYIRYRPDYPPEIMDYLRQKTGLPAGAPVADIGSGTGIFTRHLLGAGYDVYAVEPNSAMREAASELMKDYPNHHAVSGTATQTTLPDHSVALIVCAQAFHWFNNVETKTEFQRILKPGGTVALIWNDRLIAADSFSIAYDNLLKNLGSDYNEVNHQKLGDADFAAFFKDGIYEQAAFPNEQIFDETGLTGRAQSSSYVPAGDTEGGRVFLRELKEIFREYAQDGKVRFGYDTTVYIGKV